MRRLMIDIETAPIKAYCWDTWKVNIANNQIIEDWYLLSFGAKWVGDSRLIYEDQSKRRDMKDDRPLLLSIKKLLNEADLVVAHNGRTFDIKKINARMFKWGIKPPRPFRQVDTLEESKKVFAFTSNKLEYVSELVGTPKFKHKKLPGMELWTECLNRNPAAWEEMKKYNLRDVVACEKVYNRMLPWINGHPNMGMYIDSDEPLCPNCGGRVKKERICYTNTGMYQQYSCRKCGKYPRGRYIVKDDRHTTAFRKRQLVG
jgi:hypothetical protein